MQALLDMGEQPERNLMKKVKEKEKSKKISQRVHSGKPPGLPSTSYDVSFPPTMVPQFNFTSDPRNVSQFLAAGSAAAFADLNEPGNFLVELVEVNLLYTSIIFVSYRD